MNLRYQRAENVQKIVRKIKTIFSIEYIEKQQQRKRKNRKAQKILVLEGILKAAKHRFAEDFYSWNNES